MPLRDGNRDPVVESSLKPFVVACTNTIDTFRIVEPLFWVPKRQRARIAKVSVRVILHELDLAKRCHARFDSVKELLGLIARFPLFPNILGLHKGSSMLAQRLKMAGSMKYLFLEGGTMTANKARVDQELVTNLVGCTNLAEARTCLMSRMWANVDPDIR